MCSVKEGTPLLKATTYTVTIGEGKGLNVPPLDNHGPTCRKIRGRLRAAPIPAWGAFVRRGTGAHFKKSCLATFPLHWLKLLHCARLRDTLRHSPEIWKQWRIERPSGAHEVVRQDSDALRSCFQRVVRSKRVLHPLGTNPCPRQPREDTGGKEQYHLLHIHESLEGVPPPTAKNHVILNDEERQVMEEEHSPKSKTDLLPPLRVGGHVTSSPQPAYSGEQEEYSRPDDCEGKVGPNNVSPINIFIESDVRRVVRDGQHCSCEPNDDEDDGKDSALCHCVRIPLPHFFIKRKLYTKRFLFYHVTRAWPVVINIGC